MKRALNILLLVVTGMALASGCSGGCSGHNEEEQVRQLPQSDPLVHIVKHRKDTLSTETAGHFAQAFDYTKIPFSTSDLGILTEELSIPESARLVCLTTSVVEGLSNREVEALVQFVAEGNHLLVTTPIWDLRFAYLLGIRPQSDYKRQMKAEGFQFHKTIYPGFEDGSFKQLVPYYHRGLTGAVFHDSVKVIASSKDSLNTPVLIENEIGRGEVLFFNSMISFEKDYRGMLFSLALKLLEGVAYPVANVSTIFLDDFPAPLYNEKMQPIEWEYDMTHAQFVTKVWWPEMKAFADSLDIDYSAMLAFNYNANVVPPFDFEEWTLSNIHIPGEEHSGSIGLARDIVSSRHELAFHGYNHFSLWLEDWPNMEFMVSALQAARKRWRIDNLGDLPVTYVPPTNIIDSSGIEALSIGMPQMKYMSSLYIGEKRSGAGREFSPDPYNPSFFNYPRITSGFIADDNSMFKQHSLYILSGIWTHFIHPDDVFQIQQSQEDIFPSRNEQGLGWHRNRELNYGLYEVFSGRVKETIRDYPLIRFKAARDAVPYVIDWRSAETYRTGIESDKRSLVHNLHILRESTGTENKPSFWFMYVTKDHREQIERELGPQTQRLEFTPMWEGYLAQFSTILDTLVVPDLKNAERAASNEPGIGQILARYREYQIPKDDEDGDWTDTRLQDALKKMQENPNSRLLQEQVIKLAIEFDSTDIAISLLEKRLQENKKWNSSDLARLTTYYGWEGETERAWTMLEKLWGKYHDRSVIALKDLMVSQYGIPGEGFRNKWLNRELELDPGKESVLRRLVYHNQSQEKWPETKQYLKQLIRQNTESDSLYYYTLRRSFWYEPPDSTLRLLNSFPEAALPQLDSLSTEIAYLYSSRGNYSRALEWAEKKSTINTKTRLEWVLQTGNKDEFEQYAFEQLSKEPANDSLRAFAGKEFIYNGNHKEGYEILYPLFRDRQAPGDVQKLVQTEIGYMSYEQKKDFYSRYPLFFNKDQVAGMQHQYRSNEGIIGGINGTYATDNFGNTLGSIGLSAEWGNRQKTVHLVETGENFVRSDIDDNTLSDQLYALNYTYRRKFFQQAAEMSLGAGFKFFSGKVLPDLATGYWFAKDSTFTSAGVTFNPVMTNTALQQSINQVKGSLYREDYWFKDGKAMTSFSGAASWYSNRVFAYEGLGRFFVQLPFSTSVVRSRAIGELAYLDATKSYTSGVPYWTANRLFIKGVGLDVRYRNSISNPTFSLEAELIGKHDNRDGFYLTSAARLNAEIARYWQVSLNAELSSSKVYRYNNFNFKLTYTFPNKINAGN